MTNIQKLEALQKWLGMTDDTLAEYLGIHRTTLFRWKNNKTHLPKMALIAMEAAEPVVENPTPKPELD